MSVHVHTKPLYGIRVVCKPALYTQTDDECSHSYSIHNDTSEPRPASIFANEIQPLRRHTGGTMAGHSAAEWSLTVNANVGDGRATILHSGEATVA